MKWFNHVLLVAFASLTLVPSASGFELSGTVEGYDGNNVVNVGETMIRVYRNGQAVATGTSNPAGAYRFTVPGSDPIDRITYIPRDPGWQPWVARSVSSSSGDMRVPVLVLATGGRANYTLQFQQLTMYEELFILTLDEGGNDAQKLSVAEMQEQVLPRLRRVPSADRIEGLTAQQREILTGKKAMLMRLYELGERGPLGREEQEEQGGPEREKPAQRLPLENDGRDTRPAGIR